jgi:hypothetical protein
LLDKLSHTLEPGLRNAVMGDLAELKVPERRAVFELLGLILRRQAPLWRTWRPWLALSGIVGPIGVLLSLISFGVVSEIGRQALVYWQYGVPYSSGLSNAEEIETLVCVSLAVMCWSWVGGFVMGILSGQAICINGTLFYLVWFFLRGPFGILVFSARLLLSALGLMPLRPGPHLTFLQFIFFATFPLMLETILFLLPSIAGIRQGRRRRKLRIPHTLLLAAAVVTLTVLVTWIQGWRQAALEKWSEGKWNPGGPPWQERLIPLLVVSWPIVYLLATACAEHRRDKSIAN